MVFLIFGAKAVTPGVNLAWNQDSDPAVVGYKIYYGTNSHDYSSVLDVGNVTTALIPLAAYDVTYFFAATTYDSFGVESDFSAESSYMVSSSAVTNQIPPEFPPTISAIGNLDISGTAGLQTVGFSGITTGSGSTLTVTAVSSNPSLIPNPVVNYVSPNSSGSLTLAPAANTSGTALITVTVDNGRPKNNLATQTFTVNVTKTYVAPTLGVIGNVTIGGTAGVQTINLSGITLGSGATASVSAVSSNPALIPTPTVKYTSPNAAGMLSFAPATNATGSAVITVTVNNGETQNNLVTQTFTVNVTKTYVAPTLGAIGNVNIGGTAGVQTINLSGITLGSGATASVSATSSNPALIPTPTVKYTSPNAAGTLSFAPATNATGSAVITVTVNNGEAQNNWATQTFTVNVTKTYVAPTLGAISNINISGTAGVQTINLSGITLGSGSTAVISAVSSNPKLVANPTVNYISPNSTGSLSLSPATNATGSAVITVTLNNGQAQSNTVTQSFTVNITKTYVAPTLGAIGNVSISGTAGSQTVALSGISRGSGSSVVVSATSSNPALISNPAVNYTSPNTTGTLTFAPATNLTGSAVITVTVNNGEPQNNLATQSFTVNVSATTYQAPTIAPIGDIVITGTSGSQIVSITGVTLGSGSKATVTATSSNPALIPNPVVNYTSPSGFGSMTLAPAINTNGTAIITVTVNNGAPQNNLATQSFTVAVTKVYTAPSLSPVADVSILENASGQTVNFSGISPGSSQPLTITAVSSNPELVPNPVVKYTSPNSSGSLTVIPAANAYGTATITLTVNNGQPQNNLAVQNFKVVVTPVNQAPTLNPVSDLTLAYNSSLQTVNLSGISSGAPNEFQPLTVTAVSSNPSLIPNPLINYSSPLSTGTLTFQPVAKASGTATITVTVNDGGASNNVITRAFNVIVKSQSASLAAPKLTSQPSDQMVLVGKTATFKVSATGTGLKYQWMKNGVNIPKATGSTYTLKNCKSTNSAVYSVSVYNTGGAVVSSPASLMVSDTPASKLDSLPPTNGHFAFNIVGVAGYKYAVQTSPDMIHWTSVRTNSAPFSFEDVESPNKPSQFYRTVYIK